MEQQRKITDEREAQRCLAAAKAAGGTIKQWARAHGIDARSLNAWRMNLGRRGRKTLPKKQRAALAQPPSARRRRAAMRPGIEGSPKEAAGPLLVELVPMPDTPAPSSERRYVVRLGDLRLELGDDFDPWTLRRLLEVLRAC